MLSIIEVRQLKIHSMFEKEKESWRSQHFACWRSRFRREILTLFSHSNSAHMPLKSSALQSAGRM